MLRVGIEHEFVFADEAGRYLDADNSRYSTFSEIVRQFPAFAGDDAVFECKSLEQYPKRCYVEGFERHDREGRRLETLPKGLEIRTLPHASVDGAIAEFRSSYAEAMSLAARSGLSPVLTSSHPFKNSLALDQQLGTEESMVRTPAELALATRAMFTHGLHVNVSLAEFPAARMLALVDKVNFYMPALIPWSFSSPFCHGGLFEGLCYRNYSRADRRRMVDLSIRRGTRVLEFRGFDACGDARLLTAVLDLFCGFLLDESLPGKAPQQDPERLQLSSLWGFDDPALRQEGQAVLRAARAAADGRGESFDLLDAMLQQNDSYAARMKSRYAETGCIMECISGQYSY